MTGQGPRESNERLEFLGDSVLGLVTSEYLYRKHPGEHEGQLTKTKSLLVSKAILSRRALAMGLGRFVLLSHSETESGGRQRLSILADAFESVIGAIYLDQGFEEARTWIERWLLKESNSIAADKRHTNYKSHLQEYVQSTFRTHPSYRIRSEMGPDHSKHFIVEVTVGRRSLGEGKGHNKKEAEQAAARDAIEKVDVLREERRRETREPRQELEAPLEHEEAPAREPRRPRMHDDELPARRGRRDVPAREPVRPVESEVPAEDRTGEREERSWRRGRRGGAGRPARRDSGEVATPSEPRAVPQAPSVSPPLPMSEGKFERLGRETAAASEAIASYSEVEPPPSAFDEDDFEEVGRPDGPLEARHVDVFDWSEPAAAAPAHEPPAEASDAFEDETEEPSESGFEDELELEEESEPEMEFEPLASEDDEPEAESERPSFEPPPAAEPAKSPPQRSFGRKPGRSGRPGSR